MTVAPTWTSSDVLHPHPSGFQQWLALTSRILRIMAKGELIVALIVPLVFALSFYLPLKYIMQARDVVDNYAQFVMPIIVLQSMGFTAMSAAQRAAFEALTGLNTRMQSMPVALLAPLAARMASAFVRSLFAMIAAIGWGYLIGFRFAAVDQAIYFMAFVMAVGTVLALGADAIGTLTESPEAVSQAITLPYLILGMLSSGFTPVSEFPDWIEPFVRNQPISHFSYVLRDLSAGGVSVEVLTPALAWLIGLAVVLCPLGVWAGTRRG
ncbi:ABC transporter permease [Antrihabitans stalactiti]|uniref:Antibiotic transporter n=1 Tax=Antrihabitans stalactiti TaxID=2584121 RepID=A0A848KBT1_9NOCA|nr:ABC transporter permease [Antrihabitans stalactiti]NMN96343.1 antibiotic transporter [Antrihabitans stalactiti]